MNWSSLLPSTLNPEILIRRLSDADHNVATQALRDIVIFLTLSIAAFFALCVLWQTLTSWSRTRPYLKLTRGDQAVNAVITSDLSLFRELRHHLIEFPSRDDTFKVSKRRTVDSAEVFRESTLGPPFSTSRLILAIPSILTGLGVLGTFVGLQLGIGSLDFSNLEKSIRPLIQGCAVAFSSSVWGVGASLLFSWWEKAWEGFALGRVHKIQVRVDALFPRYVPEEALAEMERTSRGTEYLLKGLAVAIGGQMQIAVREGVAETLRQEIAGAATKVVDAIREAFGKSAEDLGKDSARVVSDALGAELKKIGDAVEGLNVSVMQMKNGSESNSTAVKNAVEKLNAHESVMQDMAGAATNIRQAAEAFGTMNEPLTLSATRNEEASKAQLSAAQTNERVAEQFGKIGERLPEVRDTLQQAATVIATIIGPIMELKSVVGELPIIINDGNEKGRDEAGKRDALMLRQTGELADKVAAAAAQFAKVEGLAEKLSASAASLDQASNELAVFGQQVQQASKEQRDASEASRAAAASGERTAKALEPLPGAINALTSGLESAGASVRTGAETARDSYRELITLQKAWFAGAELGLNGMKNQLQTIINSYGVAIDGQTTGLMERWTKEVDKCLGSYSSQVEEIQNGLASLEDAISKLNK